MVWQSGGWCQGDFLSDVGSGVGGWSLTAPTALALQPLLHQEEDFFRDLDKELEDWQNKRSSSGKPASLWEELAAIGEEFVDFLEQEWVQLALLACNF
eukprot:gene12261-12399_t